MEKKVLEGLGAGEVGKALSFDQMFISFCHRYVKGSVWFPLYLLKIIDHPINQIEGLLPNNWIKGSSEN